MFPSRIGTPTRCASNDFEPDRQCDLRYHGRATAGATPVMPQVRPPSYLRSDRLRVAAVDHGLRAGDRFAY